jgi:hypothetical protein
MGRVSETYTCACCGKTRKKDWSDEEAMAEARGIFSPAELAGAETVCDDCWQDLMAALPRLRAEIERDAAAAGMSYDEFVTREALS